MNMYEITPDYIFEKIKHGDETHQAWLEEALHCVFEGKEVPPTR